MSQKNTARFVQMMKHESINGYGDHGNKAEFARLGKQILHAIAARLGYPAGTYDVGWNPGGPAVSGDITLHTDELYICLSHSYYSNGFYYRSCKGREDYSGGRNVGVPWQALKDLDRLAADIRRHIPKIPDRPALPPPREQRPKKPRLAKAGGEFATPREALVAKLAPSRLEGLYSPQFIGLLGDLLNWVGPRSHAIVTSDNFILLEGGRAFLGHLDSLRGNCVKVCEDVGDVTNEEKAYLMEQVEKWRNRRG
jgi:hypothetical protein